MPMSNAAIRAISLSSLQGKLSAGMPASSGRHGRADHVQLDWRFRRDGPQRRFDDRQIVRVERDADPADRRRLACRRGGQIAIAVKVDRGRHDLNVPRAGLARAPRQIVVAGDDRVGDAHDRIDLVAEQRAQPVVLIAVEPGIVVVDDIRNALQPRDFHPRRKPRQRFLLQPDDIVSHAAPERAEAPRVGTSECLPRRPAVRRRASAHSHCRAAAAHRT